VKLPQRSAYAMLRDGKTDRSIASSVAQCLKSKPPSVQSLDVAYPQILQEIADTHKFSVTFVDVMEPSAAGELNGQAVTVSLVIFTVSFLCLFLLCAVKTVSVN